MDETSVALEQASLDYLEWMAVNAYAQSTQRDYKRRLSQFLSFTLQLHKKSEKNEVKSLRRPVDCGYKEIV
jgi:hypothetical protein